MLNKKFVFGILVMIFGIVTVGCDVVDSGAFTLTNIPQRYDGMYVTFLSGPNLRTLGVYGCENPGESRQLGELMGVRISNGKVILPLWACADGDMNNLSKAIKYDGNHSFDILVFISESRIINVRSLNFGGLPYSRFGSRDVKFSNGGTRKRWNDLDSNPSLSL